MKNKCFISIFICFLFLSYCINLQSQDFQSNNTIDFNKFELYFQNDADLLRLEHLQYWTAIVEEYHNKKGFFPFQNKLDSKNKIGLVKIATNQQRQYLSSGTDKYNPNLDINYKNTFKEFDIKAFVREFEIGLERKIEEKYDMQKVPTKSPVGYFYFVEKDGYLIWTTCITCGITKISTLLMDGFTPTVNIVSSGMKGKVTKALTREEMISHTIFKNWISRSFYKEEHVRRIEKENIHDSKN